MKIKLFLSGSLLALSTWLAAAYMHSVDISSYSTQDNKSEEALSKQAEETPESEELAVK